MRLVTYQMKCLWQSDLLACFLTDQIWRGASCMWRRLLCGVWSWPDGVGATMECRPAKNCMLEEDLMVLGLLRTADEQRKCMQGIHMCIYRQIGTSVVTASTLCVTASFAFNVVYQILKTGRTGRFLCFTWALAKGHLM